MRLLTLLTLFSVAASAQQMVSMKADGANIIVTVRFARPGFVTLSGAPYSARRISGPPQNVKEDFYRDAAGRNRTERTLPGDSATMVTIMDPLLGCAYVLDPGNLTAHLIKDVRIQTTPVKVSPRTAELAAVAAPKTLTSPDGKITLIENLGIRTMQGLTVNGSKITTTWPAGAIRDNDHPVVTTEESWIAMSLGNVEVSRRLIRPDMKEQNFSISNVVVGPPDPELFRVPAGYRIVEEKGEFAIVVPKNSASTMTKNQMSTHTAPPPAIPNAPYSGTEITSGVLVRADGTKLESPDRTISSSWRDSLGRVRTEWPLEGRRPALVEIQDPVAGYVYALDYLARTAHRTRMPVVNTTGSESAATKGRGTDSAEESLGTRTIAGVLATGTRSRVAGDNQALLSVKETWRAGQIVLLQKTTSAGKGESTVRLEHFSANEPDPDFFRIPATYKIVDELGQEISR